MRLQRWALTICLVCLLGIAGCATMRPEDDAYASYQRGDYTQALKILRPLVAQGDAWAQSALGVMYRDGHGVTQNYQEALKWYRLAAAQGEPIAQNSIGAMYDEGRGVTQNYQEALKWYRLAAAQGNADAIENLKRPEMVAAAQQYPQTYQPQQTYQPTPQPKSESNKTDMTSAMGKCSELGFKKGTEKFGDCVLKLSK